MIKSLELATIEIKYTKFIKQVINELNDMRGKLEELGEPKIEKKVIIKTVENQKSLKQFNALQNDLNKKLKQKEEENRRLQLKLDQTVQRFQLEKLGYLTEIKMLTDSLNQLSAAVIE